MNPGLKRLGLQMSLGRDSTPGVNGSHIRHHDECPVANVPGRVPVRRELKPAMPALEIVPGLPVPSLAMPALATGARGIARIHRDDGDAFGEGLVGQKRPQLMKRPSLHAGSVGLACRCPVANTREGFDPDGASGALGLRDDPLAEDVVHVLPIPALLRSRLAELPFGAFGSRPLTGLADPVVLLPASLDPFAQTIGDKAVQVGPGGRLAWLSVGSNPCLAGNPTTASNSSTAITP